MHASVLSFLRRSLTSSEVFGKTVLEVGSQNINGTPRDVILPLHPKSYCGVDSCQGNGVDVVLDVDRLTERFGKDSADIVVSTEMLEHAKDWRAAVVRMKEVLRPGGILIVTARGPGFIFHGFPDDFWRFKVSDFLRMFSDMEIEICEADAEPGVCFKGIKGGRTGTVDLATIDVERVVLPWDVKKIDGRVDLIVANWNTLPWLKLLSSQIRRFKPKIPVDLFVWDNGSTDGSADWLKKEEIAHFASPSNVTHAEGIHVSVGMTKAPYVAFMDVDAFPIEWNWLDQAVELLQDGTVGIAGLGAGTETGYHTRFVHPSFCVFRREVYERLKLSPHIFHDYDRKTAFDVGEVMCAKLREAGYRLEFVGETQLDLAQRAHWKNRVVHCLSSTPVLSEKRTDLPFVEMVGGVVKWHRLVLRKLGVWDEFEGYVRQVIPKNPLCVRYVEERTVPVEEIRLSIVIPTIGRESLRETLESIERAGIAPTDEVIVVGDGPQPRALEICDDMVGRIPVKFLAARRTRSFGGHQRNVGLGIATGTHALFMDDDDGYKRDALSTIRSAVSKAPDRLHLFRVENVGTRHPFKVLWNDPAFRLGNVTSQMICVPIVDGFLGIWPSGHCSDFGFLSDTIPRFGQDRIIWREEFIAELR